MFHQSHDMVTHLIGVGHGNWENEYVLLNNHP